MAKGTQGAAPTTAPMTQEQFDALSVVQKEIRYKKDRLDAAGNVVKRMGDLYEKVKYTVGKTVVHLPVFTPAMEAELSNPDLSPEDKALIEEFYAGFDALKKAWAGASKGDKYFNIAYEIEGIYTREDGNFDIRHSGGRRVFVPAENVERAVAKVPEVLCDLSNREDLNKFFVGGEIRTYLGFNSDARTSDTVKATKLWENTAKITISEEAMVEVLRMTQKAGSSRTTTPARKPSRAAAPANNDDDFDTTL